MTTIINRDQNTSRANRNIEETVLVANVNANEHEVKMGLADDGLDILLDLLSDPSSDCGGYVLRETYSNAYDAVKESGNPDGRIDIELPEDFEGGNDIASRLGYKLPLASKLVVRDTGCGMTTEQVEKCFIQYGGSTKRDNADAIGSKGLGALAPLSISDHIMVNTVRDGIETHAVIERRSGGNWATITTNDTDKANGTEVIVPVSDAHAIKQIRDCAARLARYNTDANLYIDGEKASVGVDGYIYGGKIEVGETSEGEANIFDIWIDAGSFPFAETHSWALLLGGYDYGNRYGNARVLIEGAPGYLNFNLSRDEIKDDAALKTFSKAVNEALACFKCPDELVEDYIAGMSMEELARWMHGRRYKIDEDGKVYLWSGYHADEIRIYLPESVYALGDGSFMEYFNGGKSRFEMVVFADKSTTHFKYVKGRYSDDYGFQGCPTTRRKVLDAKFDPKMSTSNVREGSDRRHMWMLITECGDDAMKKVFKNMSAFLNSTGTYQGLACVVMTASSLDDLSDGEKCVFANVADDMKMTADEFAEKAAAAAKANRRPGKGRGPVNADPNKFIEYVLHFEDDGERDYRSVDYADVKGKCAFAMGNFHSYREAERLFSFLIATGLTDKRHLVTFKSSKVSNAVANAMIAAGDEVLIDCRRNIENMEGLADKFLCIEKKDHGVKGFEILSSISIDDLPKAWVSKNRAGIENSRIYDAVCDLRWSAVHFDVLCSFIDADALSADARAGFEKASEVSENRWSDDGNYANTFGVKIESSGTAAEKFVAALKSVGKEYGLDRNMKSALMELIRPAITEKVNALC